MHISPSRGVYELLTMKPEQPLWKEVASSLWAVLKTIGRYYEFATGFKYLHTVPRPLFRGNTTANKVVRGRQHNHKVVFLPKNLLLTSTKWFLLSFPRRSVIIVLL